MISIVTSDSMGKKVSFDDFKKLSKGAILPLAHYRVPDAKWKAKEKIFENIKQSELYHSIDNPSLLIKPSKLENLISMKDYEESKKAH